jgi:hypothetical protein
LLAIIIINTNIYYIELYYTSNEFPIICWKLSCCEGAYNKTSKGMCMNFFF